MKKFFSIFVFFCLTLMQISCNSTNENYVNYHEPGIYSLVKTERWESIYTTAIWYETKDDSISFGYDILKYTSDTNDIQKYLEIIINTNDTTTIHGQSYICIQTIDNRYLQLIIHDENELDICDGDMTIIIPGIIQGNDINYENVIDEVKSSLKLSHKIIRVPVTDTDISLLQNGIKSTKIGKGNKTIFEYKYDENVGKKIANYIYEINEIVNNN